MPARKIPQNYRSVTGFFPSLKNDRSVAYESPLERDFYTLQEFDDNVAFYEEQPVKVPHIKGRKSIIYYPDCLITYKPEVNRKNLLADVHDKESIEEDKDNFEYRRNVLSSFAKGRGEDYDYFTEEDIRGPHLENVKFLYNYAKAPQILDEVLLIMRNCPVAGVPLTINELLAALSPDKRRQLQILPSIYHLIWVKRIYTNLFDQMINMKSIVEVKNEKFGG